MPNRSHSSSLSLLAVVGFQDPVNCRVDRFWKLPTKISIENFVSHRAFVGLNEYFKYYSIVKDSNTDFSQLSKTGLPTIKAVCTKIQKKIFAFLVLF
jgi:hypothetical protein